MEREEKNNSSVIFQTDDEREKAASILSRCHLTTMPACSERQEGVSQQATGCKKVNLGLAAKGAKDHNAHLQ